MEQQRLKWRSMEKRITGLVGKVNISNIQSVAEEIMNLEEDLITGRGPFCRAVMSKSHSSSNVYASLVAIINPEFPDVGLLLVKRVVLQFKEAYDRKDKTKMRCTSSFLAQLVNRAVVYGVLALDVLLLLLGDPSSENIEVAVSFFMECGWSLLGYAHKLDVVFREFRHVLKNGGLERRVQVSILRLMAARKTRFKRYRPGVVDLVDQVTHEVSLLHDICPETSLDDFEPKSESGDDCEMSLNFFCTKPVGF